MSAHKGQIIVPFHLKNVYGEIISSEKFLRKKNLVILFFTTLKDNLNKTYLEMLNSIYEKLQRLDTEVLVISQGEEKQLLGFAENKKIKFNILLDTDGLVKNKFIPNENLGRNISCLFITDRFSCIYNTYFVKLPDKEDIVNTIEFLEKRCPECGVSEWPEAFE
jgi:peroxiredoxin